jgi:choline dehydrogenase-like flavoprotein
MMKLYEAILILLCVCLVSCSNDPCSVLGLASSYDAIVAGSGPGGAVAARRLAEHDGRQVLLVERGPAYSNCPYCSPANAGLDVYFLPGFGYFFNMDPQAYIPGNPSFSTGDTAVQGGGSSHNGFVWIRPDGEHYFNTYFPPNWTWEKLIQYYIKVENYTYPNGFYGPRNNFDYAANFRGNSGLVQVTQLDATYDDDFTNSFIEQSKVVWPNIYATKNSSVNNGFFGGAGVSGPEQSFHGAAANGFGGTRSSSYSSYIQTYLGSNLRSIAEVRVNKILFTNTQVSGVQLVFVNTTTGNAISSTCEVATRNVVVSGGPFGTPKLLKLSGIGPKEELQNFNISVVVDLPTVGQGLDNQFSVGVNTLPPTPIQAWQAPGFLFYNIEDDPLAPNNMNVQLDVLNVVAPPASYYVATAAATLCYGESRGNVYLTSADPDDEIGSTFNFLATERDRIVQAEVLQQTLKLAALLNLTLLSNPCTTPADCSTPLKQLDVYLAAGAGAPSGHWVGTAGLGRVIDPETAGVYGTTGLYVLDSSALPSAPGCNTQLSTYALAEYGIELAIADIEERNGWGA